MRNIEQLCYLVAAAILPYRGVNHFTFRLQSEKYDCDYLESRVN